MGKRPRSQRIVFVILVLMLAGFHETGAAQTSPPSAQPLRLTLKEAVQLALKQNPQVVAARRLSLESDRPPGALIVRRALPLVLKQDPLH